MKNVLILGGGQLGSRHLQGASQVSTPTNLYVVDPSESSLAVAKERFEQTHNGIHSLHLLASMDNLPAHADVVIISTSSKPRLAIMTELFANCTIDALILEKVLFTRLPEYDAAEQLLSEYDIPTWVNCPRRSYPDYLKLKQRIGSVDSLQMVLDMPNFLTASNGLHFADLFSFLLDDPDNLQFDASGLSKELVEAKRPGYSEVVGELICKSGSSKLRINNALTGSVSQSVYLTTNNHRIAVQESHQPTLIYAGRDTQWNIETTSFSMPFQSALTTDLIDNLISSGTCLLPEWHTAKQTHITFLEALEKHYGTTLNIT